MPWRFYLNVILTVCYQQIEEFKQQLNEAQKTMLQKRNEPQEYKASNNDDVVHKLNSELEKSQSEIENLRNEIGQIKSTAEDSSNALTAEVSSI